MTNHVHMIVSSDTNKIENPVRDIKKYSSKQIVAAIQENPTESRKECLPAGKGRDAKSFQIYW